MSEGTMYEAELTENGVCFWFEGKLIHGEACDCGEYEEDKQLNKGEQDAKW